MRKVHAFAIKWGEIFKSVYTKQSELEDHSLADDCEVLGFEMDGGQKFLKKYGEAAFNLAELTRVIEDVDDIALLGSAIYARWRFFYFWAIGEDIASPRNREWFIVAFSRLAKLSQHGKGSVFLGRLKKISIVSKSAPSEAKPGQEAEQHLTINDKGQVWFSGYSHECEGNKLKKERSRYIKVETDLAKRILDSVSAFFSNEFVESFTTDHGYWKIELTNEWGDIFKFRDSLCSSMGAGGTDLSELIRTSLDMEELLVFDGRVQTDTINRITILYERVVRSGLGNVSGNESEWLHKEKLVIDREKMLLEHYIEGVHEGRICHRYEGISKIRDVLDHFDVDGLFVMSDGKTAYTAKESAGGKNYTIMIDYEKRSQRVVSGSFDRRGLPEDYPGFAKELLSFLLFFGMGEIVTPKHIRQNRRQSSEYIFCSVAFDVACQSFYYLTEDDSIETGDFVVVPHGENDQEKIAEVVNVQYFTEKTAPVAIDRLKHIIRRHRME